MIGNGKIDLPMIRYTPYEIFSGKIPVMDINFISPQDDIKSILDVKTEDKEEIVDSKSIILSPASNWESGATPETIKVDASWVPTGGRIY